MFKRTKICSAVMAACGAGMMGSPGVVMAQDETQQLQRVEVTGSSIKRIDAETALPVTVVTREEISRSGVTNMEQLVSRISAASSAGNTTGSQLAGLATYGLSSISLRGLGEQRTLVLVNGRRLAVFAGGGTGGAVDINSIPLSAVERVEVLRDGASATYGSDAVAGVVNFILRKDYDGMEATAEYGSPTQTGGGQVSKANILFGKGNLDTDKYNFMIGVDVEKSRALFARDRSFASSGNRVPYFQNGATPSGRIEGTWNPALSADDNLRSDTNPFGISGSGYGNPLAPNQCDTIRMFPVQGKGGVGGKYSNCNYDSAPDVGLFPTVERTNLFGTGKIEVSPALQIYGEAMWARTIVTETYQPNPIRNAFLTSDALFGDSTTVNSVPSALLVYPSNPAYQSIFVPYANANGLQSMIGQPVAVTLRTFLTGPRQEQDTNDQLRLVGGIQGTVKTWDYDLAASFNQAKTSGRVTKGYFSQYGLASVLSDPNSTWNPWAPGGVQDAATNQALQSTLYTGPTISGASTAVGLDGTVSTSLTDLPGGPLQLALGTSVRRESYEITVPAILGSGDIAGLGGATSPENDARNSVAIFGELNIPVLKTLELNASARWDRYSDVGSTTNGKLSARWTPTKQVLLRGALGSGFRAPTLVELHQPTTVGVSENFIDPLHAADGQFQSSALNGGNPNLRPEKSRQLSLGIVLSPVESVNASVDWFLIKIRDYITAPAALALINGARSGAPLYGPQDATFFPDGTVDTVDERLQNAASALLKGVDVDLNWNQKYSFGRLSADLNGTYMQTFDLKTAVGTQHSVGTIIQPDGSPLDVAALGVVSRWKHTLSFNWSTPVWSTTIAQNYNAGYHDAFDLDGNPHSVPSMSTYDAQVAFTGVKNLKLSLGVRNLFNKEPPIFIGNGSSFQYGYDPANYDARGRFAYVVATYKFF